MRYIESSIIFIKTESRIVVARGWGQRRMGNCLTGTEFLFRKMKKILEMDAGNDHTTM